MRGITHGTLIAEENLTRLAFGKVGYSIVRICSGFLNLSMALPLICPTCQTPLTFIAFLTHPEPITQILAHIGEPTSPPLLHPPRGPPRTELAMRPGGGQADEAARESFPDDLDQTPPFDPAEPEPVPDDNFDQSWGD